MSEERYSKALILTSQAVRTLVEAQGLLKEILGDKEAFLEADDEFKRKVLSLHERLDAGLLGIGDIEDD